MISFVGSTTGFGAVVGSMLALLGISSIVRNYNGIWFFSLFTSAVCVFTVAFYFMLSDFNKFDISNKIDIATGIALFFVFVFVNTKK